MYRNIIFDIGGVVVNYSPKDFLVDRFYNARTEKKLYEAVFGSDEWKILDRGQMTWSEAAAIFKRRGAEMDVAFEMQALLDEWTDMLSTRKATVSLVRVLKKQGLNLYYLSNLSLEVLNLLSQRNFWQLFDGGVASCLCGIAKPDPAIFKLLLEKYQLNPSETIFTDDMAENTLASAEAGITGIQFKNLKGFIKLLVAYGIDIVR